MLQRPVLISMEDYSELDRSVMSLVALAARTLY
jgi:hypothetical protein